MKRVVTCYVLVLLSAVTCVAGAGQKKADSPEGKSEYTITVIPYYSPEKLYVKFTPLVEYLRKSTGKPWELKLYPNHDSTVEAICSGEVSLALLGPVPLARSIEKCGVETSAIAIGSDGTLFYHSVIVSTDPSIASLTQLKGKQIGLFKGSTGAHIVPVKMLRTAGLGKGDIQPVFFEGQDRIMNALLSGEVNAAGMKDVLYKRFNDSRLRVLKTSEPLPNFAFVAAPKLNRRTKDLFTKALLRLKPQKNAADKKLMQDWDDEIRNGFVPPSPSYLPSVMNLLSAYREVMSEN
ncbi:MAG: PhnD/SsuA/transferrin family substrate-binding protein [Nitrospirae bacterium]|nr:PhnD/SsuA/transferrin family substrate-binding protein [Nitrospirota bacterium]